MGVDGDGEVIDRERPRPKIGPKGSAISRIIAEAGGTAGAAAPELTPALREWMARTDAEAERGAGPGQSGAERGEDEDGADGPLPSPEELTPLPKPGDTYRAYPRPSSRPLLTLRFLLPDGTRRGFPYSARVGGPDWLETGKGLVIVLRFADVVPTEAVMAGCNLDELDNLLSHHKVAWVRALPPGKMIPDPKMPVVTGILIRPWKPEKPEPRG